MSESNASSRIKRLLNTYSGLVLMGAVGIPIGIIVGAICALFGRVLLAIGAFRDEHIALLLPFLALMGLAIVFAYRTWGKGTDRGMSLVFDVGHGREDAISPRLVPLIMLSTWGTHLFGGSAGREGVAVQIGATVSHWIGRRLPFRNPGNTFLLIGMAAGFAGLFRTPLAATVFAIEVLVAGRMEYRALFPALTAGTVGHRVWYGGRRLCLVPCTCQNTCGAAVPQPLCTHRRYGHRVIGDSVRTMAGSILRAWHQSDIRGARR